MFPIEIIMDMERIYKVDLRSYIYLPKAVHRQQGADYWTTIKPWKSGISGQLQKAFVTDDAHFDASQYLFFGKDILEEVELGGLEGEEHDETAPVPSDYEFHFSTGDKELADTYASVSHIDDLSSTFAKMVGLEQSIGELKIIHVAGTKGKGSTCTFSEAILRECGLRTGLLTWQSRGGEVE